MFCVTAAREQLDYLSGRLQNCRVCTSDDRKILVDGHHWQSMASFYYFRGSPYIGPSDLQGPLKTGFLIFMPTMLYWAFPARKMILERNLFWQLIVTVLTFCAVIFLMTITIFTDPGIICRRELPSPRLPNPPQVQEINIGGRLLQLKHCKTCKIFRPEKCSHCSECDHCVQEFDHHCPWLGCCIGLRNRTYFLWFLYSLLIHAVFIFVFSTHHFVASFGTSNGNKAWEMLWYTVKKDFMTIFIILDAMLWIWMLLMLASFQFSLIIRDTTTNYKLREIEPKHTRDDAWFNLYLHCWNRGVDTLPSDVFTKNIEVETPM